MVCYEGLDLLKSKSKPCLDSIIEKVGEDQFQQNLLKNIFWDRASGSSKRPQDSATISPERNRSTSRLGSIQQISLIHLTIWVNVFNLIMVIAQLYAQHRENRTTFIVHWNVFLSNFYSIFFLHLRNEDMYTNDNQYIDKYTCVLN